MLTDEEGFTTYALIFAAGDEALTELRRFAKETGRAYHLFDYYGAPDAERVIVLMGSGAEAANPSVRILARWSR